MMKKSANIFLLGMVLFWGTNIKSVADVGCDLVNSQKSESHSLQPQQSRIMVLGNSITENSQPGYRGYLFQKLKETGYDVDFVGTKQSIPSNGGDPDHSGYSGFTVGPGPCKKDNPETQVKGNISDNLNSGFQILSVDCDIILLEIGINDFFNSTDSTYHPEVTGAKKLDDLIAKIFRIKPGVKLIVSNITPVAFDIAFANRWNSEVPLIVEKYRNQGKQCFLADVRNGIRWNVAIELSSDKLHPTASGYEKLADYYLSILEQIIKN